MLKKYSILLFVAAVIIVPVTVFGVVNWVEKNVGRLPVLNEKNSVIENFKMKNQEGEEVNLGAWENKIVVVDFFFTHCPAICPKMTRNLKRVQSAFAKDNGLAMASFSVDPERDSVARLKQYATQFEIENKNWNLLTGSKKEIYRLARKSFSIIATDGDGGPNDFIHSEKLILVDTQKKIRGFYDGTSEKEVTQLINDIKKLKNES